MFLQLSHICHRFLLSVLQIYFVDIHVCVYSSYTESLIMFFLGCSGSRNGVRCTESCFNVLLLCLCCTGTNVASLSINNSRERYQFRKHIALPPMRVVFAFSNGIMMFELQFIAFAFFNQ